MNAILSLIVCIAMLVSPTGVLPAQPETATTWTVSNLTIGVGDESVTLAPEARITAAVGSEEAQLHFELGSGEKVLMPMSGAINQDGVRFTLGTGTRTYTLSDETFMEMLGMDQEDSAMMNRFGDFFLSYGNLLSIMKDAEKYAQYYDMCWKLYEDMLDAEFVETEVDVEGEMLPGLQIEGDITIGSALGAMDLMGECGLPEVEEFVDAALEMASLASGKPVEKFSDLTADIAEGQDLDEVIMHMDCVYVAEDPMYSKVDMTMNMQGQEMVCIAESFTRGEDTTMYMVMDMNAEDNAMSYAVTMDYTGYIFAPTRMNMVYDVHSESDYSYSYEEENSPVRTYESNDSMAMRMDLNMETVDGLKQMDAECMVETISSYGYDGDLNTYEEVANVIVNCDDRREEDGSITSAYEFDVSAMNENVKISFDLNCAQGEVVDYFANTTEHPLSADTEDAGYNALMADVMGVSADAMALAADDSVMELIAMFERLAGYEESYEEDTSDEPDAVTSFEEAAEIFDGVIPAYTAPEGYTLKEIVVDPYSLYATFESADDSFEMCTYAYDSNGTYFNMKDGKLNPVDGLIVELLSYDDEVDGANVYGPDGVVFFYFSGIDQAAAEAIVAGLN